MHVNEESLLAGSAQLSMMWRLCVENGDAVLCSVKQQTNRVGDAMPAFAYSRWHEAHTRTI